MSNEERFETFAVLVSLGVYMVDISILLVIIDISIEFFWGDLIRAGTDAVFTNLDELAKEYSFMVL